jgi:hypothetical protein
VSDYLSDSEIAEIGYERTPTGWAPLDVAEEHRQTGLTRGQWRRFSFVTARGWVALPESGSKAFALATCLGKMMTKQGTFDRLRSVGDALCVVVRPNIRDRIIDLLEAADPDRRMWRKHVSGWIEAGMAHRCKSQPRGSVTLFFEAAPPLEGITAGGLGGLPRPRPVVHSRVKVGGSCFNRRGGGMDCSGSRPQPGFCR